MSFLYVIAPADHNNGPCKLGLSADPYKRLKQLQTSHPELLEVKHIEPAEASIVKILERLLHRDINYLRQRGEWFKVNVADAIAHVKFTIVQYSEVDNLSEKVRNRKI